MMPMMPGLGVRSAKLVTPDFEAHCDQMVHHGDSIHLIGNVMLLCKKHAQPLRIEGERIVLNLNDGSFVVEVAPTVPRVPMQPVSMMRIESIGARIQCTGAMATPCLPPPSCSFSTFGNSMQPVVKAAVCTRAMPVRCEKVIRLRNAQAVDLVNAIQTLITATDGTAGLHHEQPASYHRGRADHQLGDHQRHARRDRARSQRCQSD